MLNDREKVLSALREKPLKVHQIMKRANVANQEACQNSLSFGLAGCCGANAFGGSTCIGVSIRMGFSVTP